MVGVTLLNLGLAPTATHRSPDFATARASMKRFCYRCHSGEIPAAGLDLSRVATETDAKKRPAIWSKVFNYVRSKHMPPEGSPVPSQADREAILNWIDGAFSTPASSGGPSIRRLNRTEYVNSVRDLLKVEFDPGDELPGDEVAYGFDNIGDVLSVSPLLFEKYLNVAEKAAAKAIVSPDGETNQIDLESFRFATGVEGARALPTGVEFYTNGIAYKTLKFQGGRYRLHLRAYGDQAGDQPARLAIEVDGQGVQMFDVPSTKAHPQDLDFELTLRAGSHRLAVAFVNDFYRADAPVGQRDRNLYVTRFAIQGPITPPEFQSESQRDLVPFIPTKETASAAIAGLFQKLTPRAYRRPATRDEVARITAVSQGALDTGQSYISAVRLGIEALLVSPQFLFIERPAPGMPATPYQLASRLSYFLWSSSPDDRLLKLASTGELKRPEVLRAEAARMLKDPKAVTLSTNFAAQWLTLRKLAAIAPDPTLFPDFDGELRRNMAEESIRFFNNLVVSDGRVLDLLDAKYSFLNERLARYYGIDGVDGAQFRKVSLEGTPRVGVFTQGAVLAVTSNPTRTSPVKRGKWILEEILGTPPPPPPPGVGVLKEGSMVDAEASLRVRTEQHRKNPTCANCHERMDPLGFSLENFDAVGKWRTRDGKFSIDSSGVLPGGKPFEGASGLSEVLMTKKDLFVRRLSEALAIYALGRGLTPADGDLPGACDVAASQNGYHFSSIISTIVSSRAFGAQ